MNSKYTETIARHSAILGAVKQPIISQFAFINALLTSHTYVNMQQTRFMVLYDIQDDKIRNYISKYLERNGLKRVQKSVFIGTVKPSLFEEMKTDLEEANALYENSDSIMFIKLSRPFSQCIHIIGEKTTFDNRIPQNGVVFI